MDLEKLSKQKLMFVLAKTIKDQAGKCRPVGGLELGLNRRIPTLSSVCEMHFNDPNPHARFSTIEFKVILALTKPVFRLGSVKLRKIKFRKFWWLEPIMPHPGGTTTHSRIISRLENRSRRGRSGEWWHTLDPGMNQGRNYPKPILLVMIVDAVPVGRICWRADERTLDS